MLKIQEAPWFNLSNWRKIVQKAANTTLGENGESIVPFGFEVTNDLTYLTKNLNRFYCYFGAKSLEPSMEWEEKFKDTLLTEIRENDIDFLIGYL